MFESLRDAFRQAVVNFRTELNREDSPDDPNSALQVMKRELDRARDRRNRLTREVARVVQEAEEEARREDTCLRRAELASRIPDEETAELAREFADRHRRRKEILERKIEVLRLELAEHEEDLAGMKARFKQDAAPGSSEGSGVAGPVPDA
jgi:predicted RNase H-like nuclease (RuvC/YqgF family)